MNEQPSSQLSFADHVRAAAAQGLSCPGAIVYAAQQAMQRATGTHYSPTREEIDAALASLRDAP